MTENPLRRLHDMGYRSLFARFEGKAMCPHCGHHGPKGDFEALETVFVEDDDVGGWNAVECHKCHSRGLLAGGT